MNNENNKFEKPPLTVEDQLNRLQSRGIIINNREQASHYLAYISYYRFCGYAIEFEGELINGEKQYHKGTTFEEILDCYTFDRKLRLLVIDAIERIEIAVRTVMINQLSLKYDDSHWYNNKELFLKKFSYEELIKTIQKRTQYKSKDDDSNGKKNEPFIQHYYSKYEHPELPPIWMIAEILSFGTWSKIFANLENRDDQKIICKYFGISYVVMTSWLHALTYLRNLCAHHSKLWSRNFTLKPLLVDKYRDQFKNNIKFSAQAAILKILLDIISPGNEWAKHLHELIKKHPQIDVKKMGFDDSWVDDRFWT